VWEKVSEIFQSWSSLLFQRCYGKFAAKFFTNGLQGKTAEIAKNNGADYQH
jgi:hypothetical protein